MSFFDLEAAVVVAIAAVGGFLWVYEMSDGTGLGGGRGVSLFDEGPEA